MAERRQSGRHRSFLRGLVSFDSKHGALDCIIRDLSDDGARIVFSESVALPESLELRIPQKQQTLRARVSWRHGDEVGLDFGAAKAGEQDAAALARRVVELEAEIAALRKALKRMKREHGDPGDDEAAA